MKHLWFLFLQELISPSDIDYADVWFKNVTFNPENFFIYPSNATLFHANATNSTIMEEEELICDISHLRVRKGLKTDIRAIDFN